MPPHARALGAGFALFLLAAAAPALAHDVSYAHAEVEWGADSVHISLTVHAHDAALVLRVPMPEWFEDAGFVERAGQALADPLRPRYAVRANDRAVVLHFVRAHPDAAGRGVTLESVAALPHRTGELAFEGPVFPEIATHQTFVTIRSGDVVRVQDVLTASHRTARAYASSAAGMWAVWRTFIVSGVHHIAIGPDHILFVLGLLLLGGGMARVLGVVTSFTLAHSLTLAVAALGLVRVPGRGVEPLIALSIVGVAFETLRARAGVPDRRRWLAFGFGLVHGFGFASVLAEFGFPRAALGHALAAFNVGVELGQAAIVGVGALLLAALARRAPRWHGRVVFTLALGIAGAGGFWFVQRLLAPS